MLDILRGTPMWVYAVFFILSYYGVSACFSLRLLRFFRFEGATQARNDG
jgi:hypothetical protein